MKKRKPDNAIEILGRKMAFMNYADSFGTIILKNGAVLHVRSFYEFFRDAWNDYKTMEATEPKKEFEKKMKEMGGCILSNDEVDIDVREIVATVSIYKFIKNGKMTSRPQNFIGMEDYREMMGDSSVH